MRRREFIAGLGGATAGCIWPFFGARTAGPRCQSRHPCLWQQAEQPGDRGVPERAAQSRLCRGPQPCRRFSGKTKTVRLYLEEGRYYLHHKRHGPGRRIHSPRGGLQLPSRVRRSQQGGGSLGGATPFSAPGLSPHRQRSRLAPSPAGSACDPGSGLVMKASRSSPLVLRHH
jgi:hypothetical protein